MLKILISSVSQNTQYIYVEISTWNHYNNSNSYSDWRMLHNLREKHGLFFITRRMIPDLKKQNHEHYGSNSATQDKKDQLINKIRFDCYIVVMLLVEKLDFLFFFKFYSSSSFKFIMFSFRIFTLLYFLFDSIPPKTSNENPSL